MVLSGVVDWRFNRYYAGSFTGCRWWAWWLLGGCKLFTSLVYFHISKKIIYILGSKVTTVTCTYFMEIVRLLTHSSLFSFICLVYYYAYVYPSCIKDAAQWNHVLPLYRNSINCSDNTTLLPPEWFLLLCFLFIFPLPSKSFERNNGYIAPSYNEEASSANKIKMKLKEFHKRYAFQTRL